MSATPPDVRPPPLTGVVETALYVDALPRATAFYRDVLGLGVMSEGGRMASLDTGAGGVLLLFLRGSTSQGLRWQGGWIPPHDGSGPAHLAFGVERDQLAAWERHLEARGVAIESRVHWERGGASLYFRDPDGHSVELVTPGTWPNR